MNLIGEFPVAIDNKGRLRMPSGLLRQFPAPDGGEGTEVRHEFVLNRGIEPCITLYPKTVWEGIAAKVAQLNQFDQNARMFTRSFYKGVSPVETDSADRILIQKTLLEHAGIEDEAIMIAMNDRLEIWSPKRYDEYLDMDPAAYAQLANVVMAGV